MVDVVDKQLDSRNVVQCDDNTFYGQFDGSESDRVMPIHAQSRDMTHLMFQGLRMKLLTRKQHTWLRTRPLEVWGVSGVDSETSSSNPNPTGTVPEEEPGTRKFGLSYSSFTPDPAISETHHDISEGTHFHRLRHASSN